MTESNFSLEKLKAENFSLQSELSAKNQRTLEKMFRYLRTFPLEETQIELLRQDLIGMAREAEMRQEPFSGTLGKSPLSFCDDLLLASGLVMIPSGRRLLRVVGWYYRIIGGFFTCVSLSNIIGMIIGFFIGGEIWVFKLFSGDQFVLFLYQLAAFSIGCLFLYSGTQALYCASNSSMARRCLILGILLLFIQILAILINNILKNLGYLVTISDYFPSVGIFIQILSILAVIIPILYFYGAWINMKSVK